jgi:hypothetical protein
MKRNKPSGKLSPTSLRRIPQRRYGFRLTCFSDECHQALLKADRGRRSLSRTRRGSSFSQRTATRPFSLATSLSTPTGEFTVCKTGSFAICRECAKSFHKVTAAYARHGRTVFGFSSCDASVRLTELRFAGGFPKTIHRRDIGIRPVAHSGHTSLCERI